ncbi:MAG: hypothetical protein VSS75_015565 [Candidatus Parabeggiatoa sp.]|nr:hypothetical protein [Candidatus Parabeggiatoa sp.]
MSNLKRDVEVAIAQKMAWLLLLGLLAEKDRLSLFSELEHYR